MSEARPGKRQQGRRVADRYQLLEQIGRGGMGIVWRAHDELLDRAVAVKEVRYPGDPEDDEIAELNRRTLREARAAGRLTHPNVVVVHDVIEENGRPWIVMQLVDSRSLGQVLRDDGPLPVRMVAEIGLRLIEALRSAHAAGVLHRDVKPENVLLTDDGRVVLTDFGIARMETDTTMTRTGLVGTPAFIAPERLRGYPAQRESDFWSLGATLYAAVEGRPPHDKGMAMATMHAVLNDQPEPAPRAGRLSAVLMGLLEKDPARRLPPDQAERMLRAIAEDRSATPTSHQHTLPSAPLPAPATSPPRKPSRSPRPAASPSPPPPVSSSPPSAAPGRAASAVPGPPAPKAAPAAGPSGDGDGIPATGKQIEAVARPGKQEPPVAASPPEDDGPVAAPTPAPATSAAGAAEDGAATPEPAARPGASGDPAASESPATPDAAATPDSAAPQAAEDGRDEAAEAGVAEAHPAEDGRDGGDAAEGRNAENAKDPQEAEAHRPTRVPRPGRPPGGETRPEGRPDNRRRPYGAAAADPEPYVAPQMPAAQAVERRPAASEPVAAAAAGAAERRADVTGAAAAERRAGAVEDPAGATVTAHPGGGETVLGNDDWWARGEGEGPGRSLPVRRIVLLTVPVVLVVAAVALWIGMRQAEETPQDPRAGAGGTPSAETGASGAASPGASQDSSGAVSTAAPPSQATTPTPTPTATPTPKPTGSSPADVPDGWHRYKDGTGFSLALPKGWKRAETKGTQIYFRKPGTDAFLMIDHTGSPKSDAAKDWRAQEPAARGRFPGYKLIKIKEVDYWKTAADWEFTYSAGGGRAHVVNRGFVTSKKHGYAIYWKTADKDWKKMYDLFETFTATFKPAK
ncbi:serine/threonine-protein kinase [Sphaerisporangium rubeum]|uniref:non-specific serine/threonine protein kinase n=1 Tax=Sphaerisporangium rubeum TaxID=321317 RepID=A0A7X0M8Y7_9ACTN|nr:serine/threonine-protein kinase [Sphaerisporangium rubeum]MBB6474499.1 serine/threonine protein kinase [Sphaerisporangium rubeum]